MVIIESPEEITVSERIRSKIFNLFKNYGSEVDLLFWFFDEKSIKVVFNGLAKNFHQRFEKIWKDISLLSENISGEEFSFVRKPILAIGKINTVKLFDLHYEEIEEIVELITEDLKSNATEKIIFVKDYTEQTDLLLNKARERIRLRKHVERALKERDITLFVHYIFDLELKKKGAEILARIPKPDRSGYVSAGLFIPYLERENLTGEFDKVVLSTVRDNLENLKLVTDRIFVNIYPSSLSYASAVEELIKLIDGCNDIGIDLVLEITEYAIVTNKQILEYLQEKKFTIAFDDFGSGYTNFETVGELAKYKNAKVIKLDGKIVQNMLNSEIYRSIVESVSLFAQKIDMEIVYEFISSEKIFNEIRKIAETYSFKPDKISLQGFLLHKPTPLEEEIKKVKTS